MSRKKNIFRELFGDDVADSMAKVKVTVNGKVREFNFSDDISVDYTILEDQLESQSALHGFWSTVLSEQKGSVARLNYLIRLRRAAVMRNYISTSKEGGKKMPKYELDEMVELDSQIGKLQLQLIEADRKLSLLYGIVDTIRIKGDNMRSLAGFKRQEMRDS